MAALLRILFARPAPSPVTIGLQHLMIVEPLELEVMAALAGPEDTVRIVDMILEKQPIEYFLRQFNPDVFCVTGYITHIPVMTGYCRAAKSLNPDVITVAGGVHVEKCPDDCSDEAVDFRIVRNATRSFPILLDWLRNGRIKDLPAGILRNGEPADAAILPGYDFYFPIPRRDLTKQYRSRYFYVFHDKVALIKTSFGCPYQCNFCFCRTITGDLYFERPMDEVMQELEQIREKEIYIVDDNFLFSPARVREFIEELNRRKLDKRFLVYGRADFIAANPDLVRDFKKAGLRTIIIGLESFNDDELKSYNKKILASVNQEAMKVMNDAGVDCYAAIILSPAWEKNDFMLLQEEMKKLKICFVNLQPLTPLPGTGIAAGDEDLIVDRRSFARWDLAHVTMRPLKMSLPEYYGMIMLTYTRTLFRWGHLFHHLKYPVYLHWRMMKGVLKVYRQYRRILKESMDHA